jgi:hypothetical protein
MGKGFKVTTAGDSQKKGPAAIKAPPTKAGLPMSSGPTTDEQQRASSPDGPRAGFTLLPSGQRAYKDEIPYPPPDAPRKSWKESK